MNALRKFKQRLKLGFTITEPLSKRGKEILEEDWDAGYTVVNAVLNAQSNTENHGVIAKHVRLANKDYDLIQA